MNYRHIYHAGNFADVLKHAVLVLIIEHLKQKPAPFRVIDTHAGTGLYDLSSEEAQKTGEWQAGIGRILASELPVDIAQILAPYLAAVRHENEPGRLLRYPGSPRIARHLMRPGDQLVVNELHPQDHEMLEALFAFDRQTKVLGLDGWNALKSLLPPKERRGVVLIDPPFEQRGELGRLVQGLRDAVRRFATGTFLLWHPIKDLRPVLAFRAELASLNLEKLISIELLIRAPASSDVLNGTGLVVLNPPFTLLEKLRVLMPFLTAELAQGEGARFNVEWLSGERAPRR